MVFWIPLALRYKNLFWTDSDAELGSFILRHYFMILHSPNSYVLFGTLNTEFDNFQPHWTDKILNLNIFEGLFKGLSKCIQVIEKKIVQQF